MEIIKIEKTKFECQNKNIVNTKIDTICGIKGYVGIDKSMSIIYGSIPNGLVYFSDIYKVTTDEKCNNVWYAYAYRHDRNQVELRDSATHGNGYRSVSFKDFSEAYKKVLTD